MRLGRNAGVLKPAEFHQDFEQIALEKNPDQHDREVIEQILHAKLIGRGVLRANREQLAYNIVNRLLRLVVDRLAQRLDHRAQGSLFVAEVNEPLPALQHRDQGALGQLQLRVEELGVVGVFRLVCGLNNRKNLWGPGAGRPR